MFGLHSHIKEVRKKSSFILVDQASFILVDQTSFVLVDQA